MRTGAKYKLQRSTRLHEELVQASHVLPSSLARHGAGRYEHHDHPSPSLHSGARQQSQRLRGSGAALMDSSRTPSVGDDKPQHLGKDFL